MLRYTPIGASIEDVVDIIEKRGWKINYISHEVGYMKGSGLKSEKNQ